MMVRHLSTLVFVTGSVSRNTQVILMPRAGDKAENRLRVAMWELLMVAIYMLHYLYMYIFSISCL